MIKELTEIRNELLLGLESKDLLYIKMQVNKLDTLIYKHSSNSIKKKVDKKKKGTCGGTNLGPWCIGCQNDINKCPIYKCDCSNSKKMEGISKNCKVHN
jgi:hypothetical protein